MWSFFSRDASKDFNYELGEEIFQTEYSIWKLHNGKKKGSGHPVSIFVFEVSGQDSQAMMDIAKCSLKLLKTLRHPSILTYIDSLETDKFIYLVVEPVVPLEEHLVKSSYSVNQKTLALSWGLYQISMGLIFLNKDCNLSHNNICLSSVFVDRAGEWRLFGLEYVTTITETYPVKVLPSLQVYTPPECQGSKNDGESIPWARDSWGLGCLIWEVFNRKITKISFLKNTELIPTILAPLYCELVCANPKSRPNFQTFIKKAAKGTGFFKNKFVDTMIFLREFPIKETEEKTKFFNSLTSSLDSFPQDICVYRILPELINAFEFGNAGSSVLAPIFKLGKLLSEEEYQLKVVPSIVKMFSSKDRLTRAKLLQQIELFVDYIQPAIVNNQIFPNVAQGFTDTNPTIRDQTIKCMLYLAPKLNYNNLNEEMLKHFARLQSKDDQGGIRTNTTVCLGKVASFLHPQTRKKVLISAFLRALRDPFPPARTAAILALSATENYYGINDCAMRVLPALCVCTVDCEKSIREQAFKAISGFLSKLEKVSEDPSLLEKMESELQSTTPLSVTASWTSWAFTSITDKFYKPASKSTAQSPHSAQENVSSGPEVNTEKAKELSDNEPATPSPEANYWNTEWVDELEQPTPEDETSSSMTMNVKNAHDGWEDEWESLETDKNFAKNVEKLKNFFPDDSGDPFESTVNKTKISKNTSTSMSESQEGDWGASDDWDSWSSFKNPTSQITTESRAQQQEAARVAREERRKGRLKERQLNRPRKLGAEKIS